MFEFQPFVLNLIFTSFTIPFLLHVDTNDIEETQVPQVIIMCC